MWSSLVLPFQVPGIYSAIDCLFFPRYDRWNMSLCCTEHVGLRMSGHSIGLDRKTPALALLAAGQFLGREVAGLPPVQAPLPWLVPVTLPDESRRVTVTVFAPRWVVSVPVSRPEASWICVRELLPANLPVVALPVSRPLASRNVVREVGAAAPWVTAKPVKRPVASRNSVRLALPPFGRVVAVPVIRPEASLTTARSVLPPRFWRWMV